MPSVSLNGKNALHVFVYGTLRQGEINDIALAAARHGLAAPQFVGHASVPGALYDFGDWPGLLPGRHENDGESLSTTSTMAASVGDESDSDSAHALAVNGDVYLIDPALLPILDAIEGIRDDGREAFYRDECAVSLDRRQLCCLYYPVDASSVEGRQRIECGDWVAHRHRRDRVASASG